MQEYHAALVDENKVKIGDALDIQYKPGKANTIADIISRRPDLVAAGKAAAAEEDILGRKDLAAIEMEADYYKDPDMVLLMQAHESGKTKALPNFLKKRLDRYRWDADKKVFLVDEDRIVIPDNKRIKTRICYELHDRNGHFHAQKNLPAFYHLFYWPRMQKYISTYIETCQVCIRNKRRTSMAPGMQQPMEQPLENFDTIHMDWIVKLPVTASKYDAILTVIDLTSRVTHAIPTTTTATAVETAEIFLNQVVKHHGFPKRIISDRDSRFLSQFWTELMRLIGTKLSFSTAFHPETDAMAERANQTVESITRAYCNYAQDDWDKHLTMLELAINSHPNAVTGIAPFELLYGSIPNTTPISLLKPIPPLDSPKTPKWKPHNKYLRKFIYYPVLQGIRRKRRKIGLQL